MLSGKEEKVVREISNIEDTSKFVGEDYNKFVQRQQFQLDLGYFKNKLRNVETYLDNQINLHLTILSNNGFVNKEVNKYTLSDKGKLAVALQELASLPFRNSIFKCFR